MSLLHRSVGSLAVALVLAAGGTAATHHAAEACGGYVITDHDRATWALQAFLGELSQRVSFGAVKITEGTHAEISVVMDTRAAGGTRAKSSQTFLLEKRGAEWKVVDWTFPVAVPAPKKVAVRR